MGLFKAIPAASRPGPGLPRPSACQSIPPDSSLTWCRCKWGSRMARINAAPAPSKNKRHP